MIDVDRVSKWYGQVQVLADCSLQVEKGQVVVVCGPSGSGKSTLIKCIDGLEPFQKGRIAVDGISVGDRRTNLPKLRARIGMVFQSFELFPHMTALDNICLGQMKVLGRPREEAKERMIANEETPAPIHETAPEEGSLSERSSAPTVRDLRAAAEELFTTPEAEAEPDSTPPDGELPQRVA